MTRNEPRTLSFITWAAFGLLLVFGIYTAGILYATRPVSEISIAKAASFSDSFGALTSLFTGLGFIGLLATIFLQREELKLNRQELEETRKEIIAQNETLKRQRFEGVFYRMIELYKENLRELSIKKNWNESERLDGINALCFLIGRFNAAWSELELPDFPPDRNMQLAFANALVRTARSVFVRQARYVETFNSILDLIAKDAGDEEQSQIYRQVLSSQLTAHEITYLFYQSLITPDYHRLRQLLSGSHAFRSRVEMLHVPDSHRRAWELLYDLQLPSRQSRYKSPIDKEQLKDVKKEMRQIRRHVKEAKNRHNAPAKASEPEAGHDMQDM